MDPLAPFTRLIRVAQDFRLTLLGRDRLGNRPAWTTAAVARRLASGMRVLGAYLRRLLVLMALALEPTLMVKERPLRRPHGRKTLPAVRFAVLPLDRVTPWARGETITVTRKPRRAMPVVPLTRLYRQLDLMATILANPLPRARRLALHLARSRPGVLLPPARLPAIPGRWGTEVSASYDAMAAGILRESRSRPPPLPPPRRYWRSVTVL